MNKQGLDITGENKNYLAQVVRLENLRPHPNANKLQIVSVFGNQIVTGLDAKEGDLYVFFPLECAINADYLAFSNSFEDTDKNEDNTKRGFFNKHGRVRAIRLRSERSEGYIVPASDINNYLEDRKVKFRISEADAGTEFDTVDGILFCKKYINPVALRKLENANKKQNKKAVRVSKIIENQFRLHADTVQLKRNIQNISPEDWVTISYKMHGTSAVFGRVVCRKPLKWYERALKKLGVNVVDTQYDLVYSSRKVIKNQYADKVNNSYYDTDIWAIFAKRVEDKLKDGISLYGEIVNQMPNGKWIQTNYDYGHEPCTAEFYVYRITYTNLSGDVFEFTTNQLVRYCEKFGLKYVPVFYYGQAKGVYPDLSLDDHWHENFLARLIQQFNEKDCFLCKNEVPEEGVVIAKEGDVFEAYKLKSFRFLERESEELDRGEVDIETQESVSEEE